MPNLIEIPKIKAQPEDIAIYLPENVKAKWNPDIKAASDKKEDDSTINIYDMVGEDWFTRGMTAKIVSAVLSRNKGNDITVNINSPGGDFFEGVAIYNLLKEHDADVNVRIIGLAASAASVIAMAGTNIKIAESGFLMIHNAWGFCIGNKHDMEEYQIALAQFDKAMLRVYEKKTGMDKAEITAMMDKETFISGEDSIDMGFADKFLDSDETKVDKSSNAKYNSSLREIDLALAKSGHTRSERRAIIKEFTSTPGATVKEESTPCAADRQTLDALASFTATLNQMRKKDHA